MSDSGYNYYFIIPKSYLLIIASMQYCTIQVMKCWFGLSMRPTRMVSSATCQLGLRISMFQTQ